MFSFRFVYLIAAWGMKEWLNRTDWTDWLIHELFNRYLIIHSFHSFTDSFVHSLILYYDDCCGFRFAEKVQFLHSRCPMNGWMNKWINDSTCVDEWMIIKCLNKLMNQWMNKLIVTSSLYSPSSRYYHTARKEIIFLLSRFHTAWGKKNKKGWNGLNNEFNNRLALP